jgi:hypothetical protein
VERVGKTRKVRFITDCSSTLILIIKVLLFLWPGDKKKYLCISLLLIAKPEAEASIHLFQYADNPVLIAAVPFVAPLYILKSRLWPIIFR